MDGVDPPLQKTVAFIEWKSIFAGNAFPCLEEENTSKGCYICWYAFVTYEAIAFIADLAKSNLIFLFAISSMIDAGFIQQFKT
jgi:hypothetical protein